MSRIRKLPTDQWDAELRAMTDADAATPLEQGLMRMVAHTPAMAKGLIAFSGALFANRTLPRRLVELVRLRVAFHNEAQIVELGIFIGFFIGFGRLAAAWDMTEELPAAFQDKSVGRLSPWNHEAVLVRG